MLVLARAATYAALFIGFVLVFLPARVLSWSGIARPSAFGVVQVLGVSGITRPGTGLMVRWYLRAGGQGNARAIRPTSAAGGERPLPFLVTHLFVVWYEELAVGRTFGEEYEVYCGQVRRWWPRAEARKRRMTSSRWVAYVGFS
jgi:protein-S-isoprenylcysteine O-methyltransferase Ste14